MNKSAFSGLIVGALIFLVVIGLIRLGGALGSASVGSSGGSAVATGEVQRVQIGFSDETGNYTNPIIRLKRGVPAEITLDPNTLTGCFSVMTSPGLGIQGVARPGRNVIRFTPQKTGTFAFSCPMGMARGQFIIE